MVEQVMAFAQRVPSFCAKLQPLLYSMRALKLDAKVWLNWRRPRTVCAQANSDFTKEIFRFDSMSLSSGQHFGFPLSFGIEPPPEHPDTQAQTRSPNHSGFVIIVVALVSL